MLHYDGVLLVYGIVKCLTLSLFIQRSYYSIYKQVEATPPCRVRLLFAAGRHQKPDLLSHLLTLQMLRQSKITFVPLPSPRRGWIGLLQARRERANVLQYLHMHTQDITTVNIYQCMQSPRISPPLEWSYMHSTREWTSTKHSCVPCLYRIGIFSYPRRSRNFTSPLPHNSPTPSHKDTLAKMQ